MQAEQVWRTYDPVLVTEVGSTVHGVTSAAVDDIDAMGIFIEPAGSTLGLHQQRTVTWRTQPEGVPSGPDDEDLVLYTLRTWASLAAGGNPTVLLPLFVGPGKVYATTPLGDHLRAERGRFITRQAGQSFLGYALGQRESLLGIRAGKVNRERYHCAHGYDTKYAYHMLRLGIQGLELLTTGDLTLPMPAADRAELLEVRAGEWTLAQVLERAEANEQALASALDAVDLPPRVDPAWLEDLLISAHLEAYRH